ncbi:ABC transporter substrate-binding protein, partial [Salmonella enterica subsp. enterica serovar Java]|nr:ABC transporter substrate-binding protein [Salmonella enterica subsp. enterica serovar Java]
YKIITDIKNREVNVPKKINKIISIGHGVTRLLVYIDDGGDVLNKIVGIDQKDQKTKSPRLSYAFTHKELSDIEAVGMGKPFMLDLEKVLRLKPDVIIASLDIKDKDIEILEKHFNIPVVIIDDGYLSNNGSDKVIKKEFYKSLFILGDLLNKRNKSKKISNYTDAILDDIARRTHDKYGNDNIYIGGLGFRGPQGIFSSRVHNITLDYLHLKNILSEDSFKFDKVMLDKEKLLTLNPDYIFIDMSGKGIFINEYNKNKSYFHMLSAFNQRHVFYLMPQEAYGYNVESVLMNLYFVGNIFYPEQF